jgi:hypothetical protein
MDWAIMKKGSLKSISQKNELSTAQPCAIGLNKGFMV